MPELPVTRLNIGRQTTVAEWASDWQPCTLLKVWSSLTGSGHDRRTLPAVYGNDTCKEHGEDLGVW